MTEHEWKQGDVALVQGCAARISRPGEVWYFSKPDTARVETTPDEEGFLTVAHGDRFRIHVRNLSPLPEPPKLCRCGHVHMDGVCVHVWYSEEGRRCLCKSYSTDDRRKTTRRVGGKREFKPGEVVNFRVPCVIVRARPGYSGPLLEVNGVPVCFPEQVSHVKDYLTFIERRLATADRRMKREES